MSQPAATLYVKPSRTSPRVPFPGGGGARRVFLTAAGEVPNDAYWRRKLQRGEVVTARRTEARTPESI
jgi:hypothetical protein